MTLTSSEPLSLLNFFVVSQGVKTIQTHSVEELMARRSRRHPPPSRFLLWQRDDDLQGLLKSFSPGTLTLQPADELM